MDSTGIDIAKLSFKKNDTTTTTIAISGALTAISLPSIWEKTFTAIKKQKTRNLILETKDLTFTDSIGAVFILEIKKVQLQIGKNFTIQNITPELEKLLNFLEETKPLQTSPSETIGLVSKLGKATIASLTLFKENIAFLGSLIVYLLEVIRHPSEIRWRDFWRAMEDIGPRALPIIFLIGFLVGVIITFQSAAPFGKFGAQIYIVDLVGLGLVREMGPLMTSILIAGRTASAFAAEIGSMKINQEIDALTTMGLEPIKFLTIPRILAATIMTPLLSMFTIFAGLLGCTLIMISLGNGLQMVINELYNIVSLKDFFAGLLKTFIFGIVIASIGCLHGIKTTMGASAVGTSTTKAVVSSLIMLTIIDGIFAIIYYALKI